MAVVAGNSKGGKANQFPMDSRLFLLFAAEDAALGQKAKVTLSRRHNMKSVCVKDEMINTFDLDAMVEVDCGGGGDFEPGGLLFRIQ
jgi:hypothetical protein